MALPLSRSIETHLVAWRELDWPIAWSEVFGREAELVLEIGFGNGQFLFEQATAHPERDYVGIELSWSGARRLFKRVGADVRNVRALLIDAEVALERLFEPDSLAEVFVNHPCPWPKARHHRRRLLDTEGLLLLADRMREGAQLTVATDHVEYAEWVSEMLQTQDALASKHPTIEIDHVPGRSPTKYERKALAQGIPIHYFEWEKVRRAGEAAPAARARHEPSPRDPMPSLTLRDAPREPLAGFATTTLRERHGDVEIVVKLNNVYRAEPQGRDGESPTWLVEAMAREDGLRQDFGIVVVERKPGEVLVKLSDLGRPHPTHGVRRTVFAVAAWILERHKDAKVAHENLGPDAMVPFAAGSEPAEPASS